MEPPTPVSAPSTPLPSTTAPAPPSPAPAASSMPDITLPPLNPSSAKTNPEAITQINIFDFDGTLFRSPCPSHQLWQKESIGKLKSEPGQGGLGWYQDVLTLSEPYVPAAPDDRWWIASVLAEVARSVAAPHALTVLLTGRTEAYRPLIAALLHRKALCFDYALLKPLGALRTFDFKRGAIHQLLKTYAKTNEIHIYEDREEHGERFRELLAGLGAGVRGAVHMVPDGDTVLPRAQELELVRLLLARYGAGALELQEVTEYSCVLLDAASHAALRARFPAPAPAGWHYRAHHLTLNLGPLHANAGAAVGTEVSLRVVGVGRSDKAYAVKCESPAARSVNAIPHITLAFAEGASAKDSNEIREWRDATAEERLELRGTVAEMKKWALTSVKRAPAKPPAGVNIGALIRTVHPAIAGKAIGEMVAQVKAWLRDRDAADEAAITAYVRTLTVASAAPPAAPAAAVETVATAAVTVEAQHDKSAPPTAP